MLKWSCTVCPQRSKTMSGVSPAPNLKACSIEKIALCILKYLKIINVSTLCPLPHNGENERIIVFIHKVKKKSGLFKKREREECFYGMRGGTQGKLCKFAQD